MGQSKLMNDSGLLGVMAVSFSIIYFHKTGHILYALAFTQISDVKNLIFNVLGLSLLFLDLYGN